MHWNKLTSLQVVSKENLNINYYALKKIII